jgi:hypothetical protein
VSATDDDIQRAVVLLHARASIPQVRAELVRFLGAMAPRSETAMHGLIADFAVEKDPALLSLIGRFVPADRLR